MKLNQLFNDDKAVSPVIGVILMVAITVILAAVIGTFVLGLGDQVSDSQPQASFTFDTEPGDSGGFNVTATHDGGDSIDISGEATLELISAGSGTTSSPSFTSSGGSSIITAGDSAEITGVNAGTEVRVTFTSADGDSSSTLAKTTTPS